MSRGLPMEESHEEHSRSENAAADEYHDTSFDDDMEALRHACTLTGADFDSIAATVTITARGHQSTLSDSDDEIDDLELVRSIQSRFSMANDLANPLSLEPLATVLPANMEDDDEDDFATLHAIQRRFEDLDPDCSGKCKESSLKNFEKFNKSDDALSGEKIHCTSVDKSKHSKVFPREEDACDDSLLIDNDGKQGPGLIEWHQPDGHTCSTRSFKDTTFSRAAQVFIDAIKKNRSCQKFLRSKLIQIEARIEEIKKVKERVKILKDFQVSCRRRTVCALSQKKDLCAQLISARRNPNNAKVNEKQISAMLYGPVENSHVASYRDALALFPLSFNRNKWSKLEKENLQKGIKQQFQEMALQISIDRMSAANGGSHHFDNILATIKDIEITPERIREFLPKVNWNHLASMYLRNRSGEECEARWLNWEDPLINHEKWTREEEKHLLHIIQEKGINNWVDIAVSLGTNRAPFQCLVRYQRSLNASNLRGDWTSDEDAQLRAAVETFGEHNWQAVASVMEGRTGTQCSNRWKCTLHPDRTRVSSWSAEEDQRLKVAVMLFGAKNWREIAQFVPGRTQVQCRERWVNSLDPSVNWNEWTIEEDSRLEVAIAEHGYQWSKVAACVGHRTDNQCRRRWKRLFPDEVPLLRATKEIQKTALIRNFVDREAERPALGPSDFLALLPMYSTYEKRHKNTMLKENRKTRRKLRREKDKDADCCFQEKVKSKRKDGQLNSTQLVETASCRKAETVANHIKKSIPKKRKRPLDRRARCSKRAKNHISSQLDSISSLDTTGVTMDTNVTSVPPEACLRQTREDGKHGPLQISKKVCFNGADSASKNVTVTENAITRESLCSRKSRDKGKDQLCSQAGLMAALLTNEGNGGTQAGISCVPRKMRSKRSREGRLCYKQALGKIGRGSIFIKLQPSGQERHMEVVLDKGSLEAQEACFPKKSMMLGKDEHITSNHTLARVSRGESNDLVIDSIPLRKVMKLQSGKHRHSKDADDCIVAELDPMPLSIDDHESTKILGLPDIIEKDKAHVYLDGDRNIRQGETSQTLTSQLENPKKQKKRKKSIKTPKSTPKSSPSEEAYDDEDLLVDSVTSDTKRRVLEKFQAGSLSKERSGGCREGSCPIPGQSEYQKLLSTGSVSCCGDEPGGPKCGLKQPLEKAGVTDLRLLCNDFSVGHDLLSSEEGPRNLTGRVETVDDETRKKRAIDDEEESTASLGTNRPLCKVMNRDKEDGEDEDVTLACFMLSNMKKRFPANKNMN